LGQQSVVNRTGIEVDDSPFGEKEPVAGVTQAQAGIQTGVIQIADE
jgi:hypothetical protein